MRRSPAAAIGLALVLLTPACGARLDSDTRRAAAGGTLVQGDGAPGAPAAGEQVVAPADAAGGTVAAGSGATAGPVSAGTAPAMGSGLGSAQAAGVAAPAPAGGNGGATDVGVTADTIELGNISDLSGPVPGLFQGAVIGTQAYLAKVNASGGVYGRKLKLRIGDGQLDCDQNTAQHRTLVPKVFAMVGSFSLYDGCGARILKETPGIPDIHNALAATALDLPNNFSITPLIPGWRTGPLQHYKKTYGDRFTRIGTIYADAGGGAATWASAKKAIESLGGKVLYERGFSPTDTDFTADIVGMQRAGVQMVYISASDAPTFARVVTAARQQNVDWPLIGGGPAYDEGFTKRAGAAGNGVFNDQQFAPFFSKAEAAQNPAVKDFQTWTAKVAPGEKRDLFAVFGWASAELFVKALTAAGPKATRAGLLQALRKTTSFDAGGLIAPGNPGSKTVAPSCWILMTVKDGEWQRASPAKGFRCDGPYFYNR